MKRTSVLTGSRQFFEALCGGTSYLTVKKYWTPGAAISRQVFRCPAFEIYLHLAVHERLDALAGSRRQGCLPRVVSHSTGGGVLRRRTLCFLNPTVVLNKPGPTFFTTDRSASPCRDHAPDHNPITNSNPNPNDGDVYTAMRSGKHGVLLRITGFRFGRSAMNSSACVCYKNTVEVS